MQYDVLLLKFVALICLTIVEILAVIKGIDHWVLGMYTAIVGGIVGYHLKEGINQLKKKS